MLLLPIIVACVSAHVILAPFKTEGPEATLLIFQGAFIPAESYADLGLQIQAQFPGRLFVGIPQFSYDLSLPPTLPIVSPKIKVDETMALVRSAGFSNGSIFLAGHSIGGWAVQTFAQTYPTEYKAIILLGATLQRGSESSFPIDVLTISGEFDRPMRSAEVYYKSKPGNPVVVPRYLTHMAYSNYSYMPSNVQNDFQPKISAEEGHKTIGKVIANYLTTKSASFVSKSILDIHTSSLNAAAQDTITFLTPLIKSLELEGSYRIKTPCNANTPSSHCPIYTEFPDQGARTPSDDTSCQCGSPLAAAAQNIVASQLDPSKYQINSVNAFFGLNEKTGYYPHIWNSCLNSTGSCSLNVTTAASNVYDSFSLNFEEIFKYTSATEIRMKLKSWQSILASTSDAKANELDNKVTDPNTVCKNINEYVYNRALALVPKDKLDFYLKHGDQYVFANDISPIIAAGPAWLLSGLQYNTKITADKKTVVEIVSTAFVTDIKPILDIEKFKQWSGQHYCKVISPARVLEWVYLESLRRTIAWKAPHFDWNQ